MKITMKIKMKIWECKIINNFVLKSMERTANKLTEMKHKQGAWAIMWGRLQRKLLQQQQEKQQPQKQQQQ